MKVNTWLDLCKYIDLTVQINTMKSTCPTHVGTSISSPQLAHLCLFQAKLEANIRKACDDWDDSKEG
jgi:hypothetical protein